MLKVPSIEAQAVQFSLRISQHVSESAVRCKVATVEIGHNDPDRCALEGGSPPFVGLSPCSRYSSQSSLSTRSGRAVASSIVTIPELQSLHVSLVPEAAPALTTWQCIQGSHCLGWFGSLLVSTHDEYLGASRVENGARESTMRFCVLRMSMVQFCCHNGGVRGRIRKMHDVPRHPRVERLGGGPN